MLPLWQRFLLRGISVLCVALLATAVSSLGPTFLGPALLALVAIAGALVFWGASLSHVEFLVSGVLVRNGWRRALVPWPDFQRFVVAPWQLQRAGFVERINGDRVSCKVLTPSSLVGGGRNLDPFIDQLNQLAVSVRPSPHQPGSPEV